MCQASQSEESREMSAPANAGVAGSITRLGRYSREGNGYPLQYSCLENFHGQRSLEGSTVHGVTKSQTQRSDLVHSYMPRALHTIILTSFPH